MSNETILFADNLPEFLEPEVEFLKHAGYKIVTASDPEGARKILERGEVDLAILDIRLIDDNDDRDQSGLEIAKEVALSIPKIMLTGYPTWEAVRESLGATLEGISPAVDFVSKREGPIALLRAVDWTLRQPILRKNILDEFEVQNIMALPDRMEDLGPDEATDRLKKSFDSTTKQLKEFREEQLGRAAQFRFWALTIAVFGILVILAGAVLTFLKLIPQNLLPSVAGVIVEAIGYLFYRQEKEANNQASAIYEKLEEYNKLEYLLTVCDTIHVEKKRTEYKLKLIDKIIERWFSTG